MVRAFDLIASLAGLAVLSPLFLLVALLIKLEDGGPVFFRQVRVGRGGRTFRILKFRTMGQRAETQGPQLTIGADARITRIGHRLRRWKVDELPQLVNVVTGDMGLVGPRPEVPHYVAHYTAAQKAVLDLRPGITDPASIAYRHENDILPRCSDPEAFYIANILPNKIRINLAYASRATLLSNLRVILATLGLARPPVAVRPAGDRRAFDRKPAVPGGGETRPVINLGPGGALLPPGGNVDVGSRIAVQLPDGPVLQARVVRADAEGIAVRFDEPLGDPLEG